MTTQGNATNGTAKKNGKGKAKLLEQMKRLAKFIRATDGVRDLGREYPALAQQWGADEVGREANRAAAAAVLGELAAHYFGD